MQGKHIFEKMAIRIDDSNIIAYSYIVWASAGIIPEAEIILAQKTGMYIVGLLRGICLLLFFCKHSNSSKKMNNGMNVWNATLLDFLKSNFLQGFNI